MSRIPVSIRTLHDLVRLHAQSRPDSPALLAPNRDPLTFNALLSCADSARMTLGGLGITRGDRVALVLENGPDLAAAFLCVASWATAAPLNPSYNAQELAFYLSDLGIKAIIVDRGSDTVAREVAEALAITQIELESHPEEPAGSFGLSGPPADPADTISAGDPKEIALLLHTSGTTSHPKIVPLSHQNLISSAVSMAEWYELEASDVCLSIMPLFHIQGLVGGLLAPLAAGGAVVCASPFEADVFFQCLSEFQGTWYTAGPAFHKTILLRAAAHREAVEKNRLRFIRSSSAPLPLKTHSELERVFGAPVLEGYGLTETALHATSNPLPPAERKPGRVGVPAATGVEVAVIDKAGHFLPPGQSGEVVIRGPSVMSGYLNNPAVNERSFLDDWFRTGDEGRFDDQGYLTITGRIKEVINRGGEKVSPAEIDATLLKHPRVVEAATFPVPHPTLGEDVWAAVVTQGGCTVNEKELRRFVAKHLSKIKVPRRIAIVEQIPKAHTGKLQRQNLGKKLNLIKRTELAPRDPIEERICEIWRRVLERPDVWVLDDFFELGGDSLKDLLMFVELERAFGVQIKSDWWWLSEPTVETLAKQVRELLPT